MATVAERVSPLGLTDVCGGARREESKGLPVGVKRGSLRGRLGMAGLAPRQAPADFEVGVQDRARCWGNVAYRRLGDPSRRTAVLLRVQLGQSVAV